MQERIASIIREYDAQGIHRTGTAVDSVSADWLVRQVQSMGVQPELDSFGFQRLEVHEALLEVAGLSIAGIPLYDASYTAASGISGALGPLDSDADIAVAMVTPQAGSDTLQRVLLARRAYAHRAIVLVTDARLPPDGAAILNAEDFGEPFGPPVLQIPNAHWAEVTAAVESRVEARFVAHAEYVTATAKNVQAVIQGSDPARQPLVVMTPRSGWWACASERGGGIAAWLEIMRAIAGTGPVCDVIFTANTGHELGHTGLDHCLEARPDLVREAGMWIHLGANFAAAAGGAVRLQYVDESVQRWATGHLNAAGLAPAVETPVGVRPFGEARNIFDGGGRFLSILGSNGLFHHPADRWPDAVDLPLTAAWVDVLTRMALDIAQGRGPA